MDCSRVQQRDIGRRAFEPVRYWSARLSRVEPQFDRPVVSPAQGYTTSVLRNYIYIQTNLPVGLIMHEHDVPQETLLSDNNKIEWEQSGIKGQDARRRAISILGNFPYFRAAALYLRLKFRAKDKISEQRAVTARTYCEALTGHLAPDRHGSTLLLVLSTKYSTNWTPQEHRPPGLLLSA